MKTSTRFASWIMLLGIALVGALAFAPSAPASFGIERFTGGAINQDGSVDTQAGSHPYEFTTSVVFNSELHVFPEEKEAGGEAGGLEVPQGNVKDVIVKLPPGLIGNPAAVPRCPQENLLGPLALGTSNCSPASQVGQLTVRLAISQYITVGLYNMVPNPGEPARFGADVLNNLIYVDTHVRSGGDYGITATLSEITSVIPLLNSTVTLWGVPADPSHDALRGAICGGKPPELECLEGAKSAGLAPAPFLTLPTSCVGPQTTTLAADSWQQPGDFQTASFVSHDSAGSPVGNDGCNGLQFAPAITTRPDTTSADTPAGLTVEVKAGQEGLLNPLGVAAANLKDTTVTLPEGLVINPGQAAGLQACQAGQDGITTEAERAIGKENDGLPSCPEASKVGEDEIETPLLAHSLKGDVYVLQSDPPELKLLVAASGEGVNLKLVGHVHLNEATGRLTTTFAETPELPFTNFRLSFSGGARAALATPTQCGAYAANADFTPWSGAGDLLTSSGLTISSGPGGGPCTSPLPFAPALTAGATTDQAGGFTNFSLLLQRGDGQQRISGLQFKAPAGLTGELSKVPLCTNVQAEANTCPEASKIGHTVVESGPGPYPLVVPEPGQPAAPIYLTESYGGASFGLSIVVPLHVGPFTLPTQRVRAKIEINPVTTQLTITTNELPQIVAGVPTDLREVNAVIERPEFMINPTNCDAQSFSGVAYGTPPPGGSGPGTSAPISSHFQVGSCQSLKFEPKFSVSTSGRASKANGASLTAKVSYPNVPQGTDADISLVKVELPKQLPSRLTTLQKACTAKQFEVNPANCPKESKIGMAVVHTPLLPVPLVGPAIFVSHGGEAFPSLTLVLQGDGVTVDLVGTTFISKTSVTSTTFKTVPDQPFSTFELTLPQGEFSALATNLPEKDHFNLCGQKLMMPTEMIGQNGAVIRQSTQVSITGCAKRKMLTRAQKLAAALKACHKDRNKSKRANCERQAQRKYGAATTKKAKGKRKK